ncbi:hypothetical protein [Bradyrhizobium sp. SZCCHNRI2013]|uniref:hypothetical protein n=1 Tax=Bradyrhizobium sp. SZCCHNRI2013 TaxID=3057284 RepID=UPI0029163443|nr:hypothetical protein [Bradyrhizobium sp. SZCCHNRI2013]
MRREKDGARLADDFSAGGLIMCIVTFATSHCEERSDEAIQNPARSPWIASLRSQ